MQKNIRDNRCFFKWPGELWGAERTLFFIAAGCSDFHADRFKMHLGLIWLLCWQGFDIENSCKTVSCVTLRLLCICVLIHEMFFKLIAKLIIISWRSADLVLGPWMTTDLVHWIFHTEVTREGSASDYLLARLTAGEEHPVCFSWVMPSVSHPHCHFPFFNRDPDF